LFSFDYPSKARSDYHSHVVPSIPSRDGRRDVVVTRGGSGKTAVQNIQALTAMLRSKR
jgi:hypothetical protein